VEAAGDLEQPGVGDAGAFHPHPGFQLRQPAGQLGGPLLQGLVAGLAAAGDTRALAQPAAGRRQEDVEGQPPGPRPLEERAHRVDILARRPAAVVGDGQPGTERAPAQGEAEEEHGRRCQQALGPAEGKHRVGRCRGDAAAVVVLVEPDRRAGRRHGQQVGGEAPVVVPGDVGVDHLLGVAQGDDQPRADLFHDRQGGALLIAEQDDLAGAGQEGERRQGPADAVHPGQQRPRPGALARGSGRWRPAQLEGLVDAGAAALVRVDEHATAMKPGPQSRQVGLGHGAGRRENEEQAGLLVGSVGPCPGPGRVAECLGVLEEGRGAAGAIAVGAVLERIGGPAAAHQDDQAGGDQRGRQEGPAPPSHGAAWRNGAAASAAAWYSFKPGRLWP
jgi:hypothetical protein